MTGPEPEPSFDPPHEDAIVEMARRTFRAIGDVSDEVSNAMTSDDDLADAHPISG